MREADGLAKETGRRAMPEESPVEILMATYNGGAYLAPQLESLLAQTHRSWRLFIRDDGSSDNTLEVARKYAAQHPEKIKLLEDQMGRKGAAGNFNQLLLTSPQGGRFTMFCDQDDVWMADKIEKSVRAAANLEAKVGAGAPLLVHTDSTVVNANLEPIASSLLRYVHREPDAGLNRLCVELPIFGHAILVNRPLREMAGGVPEGFISWDWWFAFVATAFGRVLFIDEPTVLFRRHEKTYSGTTTKKHRLGSYFSGSLPDYRQRLHCSFRQCEIFYERFGSRLTPEHRSLMAAAAKMRRASWLGRRALVLRHRFFKTGLVKNFGLLAAV